MDTDAHSRVTELTRSAVVLAACAIDITINYPLWVYAKRITAGLGRPPLREVYKGGGSLLFACGPMVAVQDRCTHVLLRALGAAADGSSGGQPGTAAHALAACVSGAVGAVTVGSQVESVIMRAHAQGGSVLETLRRTCAANGLAALAAPYGTLMVAAREVPYSGTLFFLSGFVRGELHRAWGGSAADSVAGRAAIDVFSALCSAAVAGPLSHAPAVVASHQQAHGVTITAACRDIAASGGLRAFYRGVVPRTVTLAGTLLVIPAAIEAIQPWVEY